MTIQKLSTLEMNGYSGINIHNDCGCKTDFNEIEHKDATRSRPVREEKTESERVRNERPKENSSRQAFKRNKYCFIRLFVANDTRFREQRANNAITRLMFNSKTYCEL